jgi:FkbM family methyltransferase
MPQANKAVMLELTVCNDSIINRQKLLGRAWPDARMTITSTIGLKMRDIKQLAGHQRMIEGRHGLFVYNMHDQFMGRALEYYGECCEHEADLFRQLVRPGSVAWDVGANIGVLTLPLARWVGVNGQVIAFEPQLEIFHILAANIAINSLSQVRAMPYALGNRQAVLDLPALDYSRSGNFGGASLLEVKNPARQQVECRTIDDLAYLPAPQFIKIDVEGMELQVLQGGSGVIGTARPIIYCENDRVEKSAALIEYLWSLDYSLYWHTPMLFNPDNYFNYQSNIYGEIRTFNMLCLPDELGMEVTALVKITDQNVHPCRAGRG